MDFEKIKANLVEEFNKDPYNADITGKLASAYMETRDFEGAYEVLKYGAEKIPCIQTFSNLGYFYLYEGEPYDDRWVNQVEKAVSMLEKAVALNPLSHVPYSVLGEAYLICKEYCKAEYVLRRAVSMEQTFANLNNLGTALYRQQKYEEAKAGFYNSHLKRKQEYYTYHPYLNYGMALAKLGMKKEAADAARDLINIHENEASEVELVDIISIYYEIKDYGKAAQLFPKALEEVAISPDYFKMYIYVLKQLGQENAMEKLYIETVNDERKFIRDIGEDDELDDESREYQINDALDRISMYENIYSRVRSGEIIQDDFEPYIEKDCYLFGCLRHGNKVYSEAVKANEVNEVNKVNERHL